MKTTLTTALLALTILLAGCQLLQDAKVKAELRFVDDYPELEVFLEW